jgi:uncharacterized RDD family membrane protein YckC
MSEPGAVGLSEGGWAEPSSTGRPVMFTPAGWWARVGATIIDGLITLACAFALGLVGALASADTAYALGLVGYALAVLFYAPVLLATNNGQTWGKQATGVRVICADSEPIGFGRAFTREVLVKAILLGIIPVVPLINSLWPLWQDQHKALHDLICGTRVIEA